MNALKRISHAIRSVNIHALVVTAILLSWISVPVAAQEDARVKEGRALVHAMMESTSAPGVAVSIGVAGHAVWSEGFGYADVEQRVPVYPAITRFRVGSVAKPMTAVAVGQLYEQGRLDLDAPVQNYVPSFPVKPEGTITTRLLTGHLAGIRHYKGNEFLSQTHYATVLEGLDIFKDDPLLHAPDTRFSYSSYGWNLVSAVVESASTENFLQYMPEHVFIPIGMEHTVADQVSEIIENRSRYYVLDEGRVSNAPPVDNSYKWAGGGYLSTSEDLLRFGFAHLGITHTGVTILKPDTIQLLWTPQRTIDGVSTGYGIGWSIGTDSFNRHFTGHGGGSVGGTTSFRIYPESKLVIVIISNMSDVSYGDLTEKLAGLFMDKDE